VLASGLLAPEELAPSGWQARDRTEVAGWRAILFERT
jgi:hypothetical protein